jgi:hypothetical protein
MEKTILDEIRSDIKYKRDSLHLAHEDLKRQGDFWNKIIIFISLGSSLIESTKMKMAWTAPGLELIPIILSSAVAGISSLIKFKRYNEQQEVLVQSCTVLTATLAKARNSTDVDESLLREYHEALELLETSLYPDVRKRFLRASQKNLVSIISNEDNYFQLIQKAKKGEDISKYADTSPEASSEDSVRMNSNRRRRRKATSMMRYKDKRDIENGDNASDTPDEEMLDISANMEVTTPFTDRDQNAILSDTVVSTGHEPDKDKPTSDETDEDKPTSDETDKDKPTSDETDTDDKNSKKE